MKNWTNDPNGLVFYKGEYHLFFQHNPAANKWGNMTWGHAVSPDLVRWTQLANAIEPDKLGTIFSGSAVVDWANTAGFQKGDEKTIVAIYTAAGGTSEESKGQPFTQCIAYSNDRGRTFTKYEKNPVLPHLVGGNRDPKVVWFEPTKQWVMALFKDKNVYAFFASPDLETWTHLQDMETPGCGECPDFFAMPVDGDKGNVKWVWTAANGHYLVGTFDGKKFTPDSATPLPADWGKNYYAVQSYSDIPESDGRRIQIAWMRGGKYPGMPFNQQMSFPCEMRLRTTPEGLRIFRMPVRELETLRSRPHEWKDAPLAPDTNLLSDVTGDLFEIRAEIEPGEAAEIGFKIRGETVSWTAKDKRLACRGGETAAGTAKDKRPADLDGSADLPPVDGRLKLVILVDRTSIEVFANDGRAAMTSCFLPKPSDKPLTIYATGGAAKLVSLQVFELRSAWPAGEAGK
jgi:sucrose-6-phosphate hydrolase SacC (GH32 family)